MRQMLRSRWLGTSLFWTAVTALFLAQLWWLAGRPGDRVATFSTMVWVGAFYITWLPVSLAVWPLTGSWRPATLGWRSVISRHVLLAPAVVVVHGVLLTAVATAILGLGGRSFQQVLWDQLLSRAYFDLFIYAGVVAAGQALWLTDRAREHEIDQARLEAQLADARLRALQAQVHPHFLFNCLHAIATLAREGRQNDVVRMIADLSELLRNLLQQGSVTRPLRDEVDFTRRYLAIQQARFGGRLTSEFAIEPAASEVHVPTLTLQTLVDNAVRHGIATNEKGGTVRVRAVADGHQLTLVVANTGRRPPDGWSVTSSGGTGLSNLRTSLRLLHGEAASVEAAGRPDGFEVVVTVPRSGTAAS
jgi:sensor histidine kinase YesM